MTETSVGQQQDAEQESDNPLDNMVDNQLDIIAASTTNDDESVLLDDVTTFIAPVGSTIVSPLSQHTKESSRVLHAYLSAVILVNFCLLFLKGYAADLGYWQDWINQLARSGYDGFNANYPPFYIHWLYLLSKFYSAIGIPVEANNFLKFLTQLPVVLSHCFLTAIIYSLLNRFSAQRHLLHIVMMLTVFNPTILVNGPIWGQVDLIPITIVICALLLNFHERFSYFAVPIFLLALLTKFQMIAFAPVFGFLFFRNFKKNLVGVFIASILGALVFMPSIAAGHFLQAFKLAYIDTLGQYPMTTFNAANIWILLTSNTAPDSQVLFGVPESSPFAKIFIAKNFGMLLFTVIALWIFLQGAYKQTFNKKTIKTNTLTDTTDATYAIDPLGATDPIDNTANGANAIVATTTAPNTEIPLAQALFSSMICAIAFFTLLPAMHERYLFPAAALALAYVAIAQKKLIYPIVISLLCSLNMFIILEVNGSDIWHGLAWIMVAIMTLGLLEMIFGEGLFTSLKKVSRAAYQLPALSVWVFIAAVSVMFFSFYDSYRIHSLVLKENELLLTSLPQISAVQDYGSLKYNRSYDGNILSVNNKRYEQGLGTHANSNIQYELPEGASQFSFIAGLDDEVGTADVQFSVWGDEKLLWQSEIFYGYEKSGQIYQVDVSGVKELSLKVTAIKADTWDHADWINTVIKIKKKTD